MNAPDMTFKPENLSLKFRKSPSPWTASLHSQQVSLRQGPGLLILPVTYWFVRSLGNNEF